MLTRLKALRTHAGISQQKLAEVIGVTQQSINKYENHNVEPDTRTLIALADYFNTSVDYLIGRSSNSAGTYSYELSNEEAALIESWRNLNTAEKTSIRLIVDNYLSPF